MNKSKTMSKFLAQEAQEPEHKSIKKGLLKVAGKKLEDKKKKTFAKMKNFANKVEVLPKIKESARACLKKTKKRK